jgi:hypothetical protein
MYITFIDNVGFVSCPTCGNRGVVVFVYNGKVYSMCQDCLNKFLNTHHDFSQARRTQTFAYDTVKMRENGDEKDG